MSSGIVFYIPGCLLLLAAVLKLSAGRPMWRDPLVASTGLILLIGSLVRILSAPPTIRFVNDVTGVANFVQASRRPSAGMPSNVGTLRSTSTHHQMMGLSRALASSPIVAGASRQSALRAATSRG